MTPQILMSSTDISSVNWKPGGEIALICGVVYLNKWGFLSHPDTDLVSKQDQCSVPILKHTEHAMFFQGPPWKCFYNKNFRDSGKEKILFNGNSALLGLQIEFCFASFNLAKTAREPQELQEVQQSLKIMFSFGTSAGMRYPWTS